MTDVEKFIALYRDLGIDLTEEIPSCADEEAKYCIRLRPVNSGKFFGLYSEIYFDANRKFLDQGFLE